MFAGPEKELLTIKCFSESAFPGEFLSKHLFFGLECLSTRAISEATTVLQQLPMNQFLLESLTNLPRKIFKYASLHFGLERLSSIFWKDSDSYPTLPLPKFDYFLLFLKNLETHLLTEVEWRGHFLIFTQDHATSYRSAWTWSRRLTVLIRGIHAISLNFNYR